MSQDEDSQQFEGKDDKVENEDIDERIKAEVESRGETSAKFTDKVKPAKIRKDADESVPDTHEYSAEEKQAIDDNEQAGEEQGDFPIDPDMVQEMDETARQVAGVVGGGIQGPLYKKMMREVTDQQSQDITFWATRNTINLNPVKWSQDHKPVKWKYNYRRQIILNEIFEKIQVVYNTPLTAYERNRQLAELYYGVPKDEFDKQDAELWIIILRAQQFRTNLSFRRMRSSTL